MCTRAPGLVEQLARTGAVVVLDPEREGIVRAAGDLGLSRVLVLPCDADSAARAHEAARYLAARAVPAIISGPAGTRSAVYSTRSTASGTASDPFPRNTQLLVYDTVAAGRFYSFSRQAYSRRIRDEKHDRLSVYYTARKGSRGR